MIEAFKNAKNNFNAEGISIFDAIRLQLTGLQTDLNLNEEVKNSFEISYGQWFESFIC